MKAAIPSPVLTRILVVVVAVLVVMIMMMTVTVRVQLVHSSSGLTETEAATSANSSAIFAWLSACAISSGSPGHVANSFVAVWLSVRLESETKSSRQSVSPFEPYPDALSRRS